MLWTFWTSLVGFKLGFVRRLELEIDFGSDTIGCYFGFDLGLDLRFHLGFNLGFGFGFGCCRICHWRRTSVIDTTEQKANCDIHLSCRCQIP